MSTSLRTTALRAAISVCASGLFLVPAFAHAYSYNYDYNSHYPNTYSSTSCDPYVSISCPATTYAQCRNGQWVCVLGTNNVQVNTPSIDRLTPSSGMAGTRVTIEGWNFLRDGNVVYFGSSVIANVSSSDGRHLTFTVPYTRTATCNSNYGCAASAYAAGTYDVWVRVPRRGNTNRVNFTITQTYYNYNNNYYNGYNNHYGCSGVVPSCSGSRVVRCTNGSWNCVPTYQDDYGYNNYNSYNYNGSCSVSSQPYCNGTTPVCSGGVWRCNNSYYNNYNANTSYYGNYNYNYGGGSCTQPRPNCGNWTPNCVSGAWRCDPPGGNYSVTPYGGGYYQGNTMYQGGGGYYGW